jgi:hypothetical protein
MPAGLNGIATRGAGTGGIALLADATNLRAAARGQAHRAVHDPRKPARIRRAVATNTVAVAELAMAGAKALGTFLLRSHCPKSIAPWFPMIGAWNRSRARLK